MKIYWNGTSKNIIGSKIRQLRQEKDYPKPRSQASSSCSAWSAAT